MKYQDVKLTWTQNVLLVVKVYFQVVRLSWHITFLSIFVPFVIFADNGRAPWGLKYIAGALFGWIACIVIFILGPLLIQGFKENLLPVFANKFNYEKGKLQEESLNKIDDIILKK